MSDDFKNVDKFIQDFLKIRLNFGKPPSLLEFVEEFSAMYDHKPSYDQKQAFSSALAEFSDKIGSKSPISSTGSPSSLSPLSPPSASGSSTSRPSSSHMSASDSQKIERSLLKQIWLHAVDHPLDTPRPYANTPEFLESLKDMRVRHAKLVELLERVRPVRELLPDEDVARVDSYVCMIRLPPVPADKPAACLCEADEEYYRHARDDFPFPRDSVTNLINENNRLVRIDVQLPPQPQQLQRVFLPNAVAKHVAVAGSQLTWKMKGTNTFFVDAEMNEGLYKIVFSAAGKFSFAGFGVSVKRNLGSLSSSWLGRSSGSCSIRYNELLVGGMAVPHDIFDRSGQVTVGLEFHANTHTLFFFVNEMQIPCCVTKVPPSVYFGVTGHKTNFSVRLEVFSRLPNPSVDPVLSCSRYVWR